MEQGGEFVLATNVLAVTVGGEFCMAEAEEVGAEVVSSVEG